jgi:hypothetical protein
MSMRFGNFEEASQGGSLGILPREERILRLRARLELGRGEVLVLSLRDRGIGRLV